MTRKRCANFFSFHNPYKARACKGGWAPERAEGARSTGQGKASARRTIRGDHGCVRWSNIFRSAESIA